MAALDPLAAGRKKEIFGWAMFDFANSPFTTLVVTFVYATYFTKAIAENEVVGTALWSRGVTITALVVALASPLLGAVADRGGYRKRFLVLSTLVDDRRLPGALPGAARPADSGAGLVRHRQHRVRDGDGLLQRLPAGYRTAAAHRHHLRTTDGRSATSAACWRSSWPC